MPIQRDIVIYQGTSYTDTVFITEGKRVDIKEVISGNPTEIKTATPHFLAPGDYALVSGVEAKPNLSNAFLVDSVPDATTVLLAQSVTTVRKGTGKIVKSQNITGSTFKGQIRQERIRSLGNVVGSIEAGSRELQLEGRSVSIDIGEEISVPEAGLDSAKVLFISTGGEDKTVLLDRLAGTTVTKRPLFSVRKLLASFQFDVINPEGGKLEISIPFTDTAMLPVRFSQDNYFYDIKYQSPDGVIKTLVFGEVEVIPQITPSELF